MSLPVAMHQLVVSKCCTKNVLDISFEWKFLKISFCVSKISQKLCFGRVIAESETVGLKMIL